MEQKFFREKSIERISSPEQLNDYVHVTTPAVWIVLLAVILLLSGFLCWCSVAAVESYAVGDGVVRNGVMMVTFEGEPNAENIEAGMRVQVGEYTTPILSVGEDQTGSRIAVASADIPDGSYDVRVGYKRTQIIHLLFN